MTHIEPQQSWAGRRPVWLEGGKGGQEEPWPSEDECLLRVSSGKLGARETKAQTNSGEFPAAIWRPEHRTKYRGGGGSEGERMVRLRSEQLWGGKRGKEGR